MPTCFLRGVQTASVTIPVSSWETIEGAIPRLQSRPLTSFIADVQKMWEATYTGNPKHFFTVWVLIKHRKILSSVDCY
jgi:hypothetical protein